MYNLFIVTGIIFLVIKSDWIHYLISCLGLSLFKQDYCWTDHTYQLRPSVTSVILSLPLLWKNVVLIYITGNYHHEVTHKVLSILLYCKQVQKIFPLLPTCYPLIWIFIPTKPIYLLMPISDWVYFWPYWIYMLFCDITLVGVSLCVWIWEVYSIVYCLLICVIIEPCYDSKPKK